MRFRQRSYGNDHIKLDCLGVGGDSEILLFSATGSDFGIEIYIVVRQEEVAPSLGDDENITVKVGEEKTIGDLSQVTDEDGNSYILHEYNYQVSDYAKDIVSITNMTEEGVPVVSDDYVTALKVTGKKPGKVVVEVTLCNNDRVPIMVVDSVKPMITKKYTITVLGEEQPDSKPEEAKVKKIKKNKKLMPKGHAPKLRYLTSDISVATVNAKGKITAKGKGSCVIYVFAHNGAAKQVKVTVN